MSKDISRRSLLGAGVGAGVAATIGIPAAHAAGTSYTYQRQETGYWCSAASARIALSAPFKRLGRTLPSQDSLARGLILHPYDGDAPTTGLKDPTLIATVLNNRLGLANAKSRYRFRLTRGEDLAETLRNDVRRSINAGYPVVINMKQVDSDTFDGHYIAIVGYGAERYQIADPYDPNRNGVWRYKSDIVRWNKLNRYTAFVPG